MSIGRRFKRRKYIVGIGLVSVILALAAAYAWFFVFSQPAKLVHTNESSLVQPAAPAAIVYSFPVRLLIPKIDVDAAIDYMGLTPAGDMESPSSSQSTGWYKYGPRPGNVGNAVIAGHLGLREQSVFMDLDELKAGDELSVVDDQGQSITFVVRQTRVYGKDDKPDEVFTASDTAHLNLITCTGDWIESEKTYSKRLVVFADKII